MAASHRIRYQQSSALLVGIVVPIACLVMGVVLRQATSAAFGPMRDTADVRGCTITRDAVTGQELRTGCSPVPANSATVAPFRWA